LKTKGLRQTPERLERIAAAGVFLAVTLAALLAQRPAMLRGDAEEYYRMAAQYTRGETVVSVSAPFVYRVATPWLAARVDPFVSPALPRWLDSAIVGFTGVIGAPGFYAVNILGSFAALMLLVSYLRLFVSSAATRVLLVTFWMIQWHTPVRYTYFAPVNVEALFLVCMLLALLAIERLPSLPAERGALAVAAIVFAGTFVRESMLLIAVVFAIRYIDVWKSGTWRHRFLSAFPLLAGLAALVVTTRLLAVPSTPTSPIAILWDTVRTKSIFGWVLGWFFTFGPAAIALLLSVFPDLRAFLRQRPWLLAYLAGCAVLAYAGGTDTERILGWAFPIVLVLLGRALERHRGLWHRNLALVVFLVASVLVSSRIFWPIPWQAETHTSFQDLGLDWTSLMALLDKVFVIENYYANLWSHFGSGPIHAAILVADIVLTAVVVTLLARSAPAGIAPFSETNSARSTS
jgi:hypothetical protein